MSVTSNFQPPSGLIESSVLSAHRAGGLPRAEPDLARTHAQLYSARTALAGCRTLSDMWSHQDSEQLHALRDRLSLLQEQGVVFARDSWPEKLLRAHPRCWALLPHVSEHAAVCLTC
jgi:hypothetical protein